MINLVEHMKDAATITYLGHINDPTGFSQKDESGLFSTNRRPTNKAPGGERPQYEFCGIPDRFLPTVQQTIDLHLEREPKRTQCWIRIVQGTLKPGETSNNVAGKHVDAGTDRYPMVNAGFRDTYIIYDDLPTIFYPQSFALPENLPSQGTKEEHLRNIFDQQANTDQGMTFPAHHIIHFDALTVHEAAPVLQTTDKTFMTLRFG